MKLNGKVAIITGSSSGIGKATALLFAKEGASVVVNSRSQKDAEKVVKEIKKKGGKAIAIAADVSKDADVKNLIQQTIKKYKRIDILYNNAGIELSKSVTETAEQDWDKVLAINLKGVYLGCKYAIPKMKKGGVIINTASTAGIVGFQNLAAYCASKGGVVLLTKEMALDYAKKGIRVNCICPGAIETPLLKNYINKTLNPAATKKQLGGIHPMNRLGQPEEIAKAALFLASDDSSFVTGHALIVDGGLTAQ